MVHGQRGINDGICISDWVGEAGRGWGREGKGVASGRAMPKDRVRRHEIDQLRSPRPAVGRGKRRTG